MTTKKEVRAAYDAFCEIRDKNIRYDEWGCPYFINQEEANRLQQIFYEVEERFQQERGHKRLWQCYDN